MDVLDFCRDMLQTVSALNQGDRLPAFAGVVAGYFGVSSHEVGLFRFDEECHLATFEWPPNSGKQEMKVPISLFKTSMVAKVVEKAHGMIDNDFAETAHLRMFEHSLTDKEACIPIQKIMSAPGYVNGRVSWILQVAKKGQTKVESGQDFNDEQLRSLEIIAQFMVGLPI